MTFEYGGKTYEVRDITRGERRLIASLYPDAFGHDEAGNVVLRGRPFHALCEEVLRLSGLKEEMLDELTAMAQNTLLIALASEYATGLAGKGSGV